MSDWIRKTETLEEKIEELEAEVAFLRRDNLVKAKLYGELLLKNKGLNTYQWCTIQGNRWVLAVGDKTATIYLDTDEKTYHASVNIEWCAGSTIHESSTDCLKKAKAACIQEIEEQTAYEKLLFSPEFEGDE